ncbi:class I SAM-dependent methyltransferase [Oceanibium sediminis]|uniref:class I SAM-dependent methyltransferase n=1 Tax=Oceanibium sediminis TaxID=2026339 RepID=UPI0013009E50|nr:class I SAM-dependent methyltransferase [Oceanibium sediminis]
MDDRTLAFYDGNAAEYADFATESAEHPKLAAFAARLPDGARVLDFGCGVGWAAAALRDMGHTVDALDASAGLAEEAKKRYDLDLKVAHFKTLSRRARYDAIWSHYALQHADREDRADILQRIHTALRPGGLLYIGVQKGPRDWRDDLGRLYTPFREEEMTNLLQQTGFTDWEITHGTGTNYDGTPSLNLTVWARA